LTADPLDFDMMWVTGSRPLPREKERSMAKRRIRLVLIRLPVFCVVWGGKQGRGKRERKDFHFAVG